MEKLTKRQSEILALIKTYIEESGMPPTRMEIAGTFGFRSPNAAEEHLRTLARKGYIEMLPGASRGIRLIGQDDDPEVEYRGYVIVNAYVGCHARMTSG